MKTTREKGSKKLPAGRKNKEVTRNSTQVKTRITRVTSNKKKVTRRSNKKKEKMLTI